MSERRPTRGYFKSGDVFIWMSAGATAIALILIIGVLYLVATGGLGFFWPSEIVRYELRDGTVVMGQLWNTEEVRDPEAPDASDRRLLVKAANRRINADREFTWIRESDIVARSTPPDAVLLERSEYGDYIGFVVGYRRGEEMLAEGDAAVALLREELDRLSDLRGEIEDIERGRIGDINEALEATRRALRAAEAEGRPTAPIEARRAELEAEYEDAIAQVTERREALLRDTVLLRTADGRESTLPAGRVYRVVQPNDAGVADKAGVYAGRLWDFVSSDPREANLEGGIFPAIFGTVLMTFLMTVAVVPLGAVAGLYLREYARQGTLVRAVRIAVNNLAGVPSIVFGVFGLGFFVYMVGGSIDRAFFSESLPAPTFGTGGILWASLTLALLTVPVVIVATEEGLAAVPRAVREGSLALGASKWETTWRVVLPAASPGILTGVILAIARAAGEVAPLMLVGAVKTATQLPLDSEFPFLHVERKFMHLGFHIFDVGFQSPNVEAAKPMVYMTTLLLVGIVVLLNITAMWIRNRLRTRYRSSSF